MKGKKNINELWDDAAADAETEKIRGRYLTDIFLEPVKIALKEIQREKKRRIRIFKCDLWNEGIDLQRNILAHIKGQSREIHGADISYLTCKKAKKNTRGITAANCSITYLPYRQESFDVLLDMSTSDHLPARDMGDAFKEYRRVLNKEGIAVIIFDWWGFFWKIYFLYLHRMKKRDDTFFKGSKVPSRYIHPIGFMKKTLAKAGFSILHEYCIDYTGWTWNRLTRPVYERLPYSFYRALVRIEYSWISKYL